MTRTDVASCIDAMASMDMNTDEIVEELRAMGIRIDDFGISRRYVQDVIDYAN